MYLIPCWFCTFAHWQRNDQSIILKVYLNSEKMILPSKTCSWINIFCWSSWKVISQFWLVDWNIVPGSTGTRCTWWKHAHLQNTAYSTINDAGLLNSVSCWFTDKDTDEKSFLFILNPFCPVWIRVQFYSSPHWCLLRCTIVSKPKYILSISNIRLTV